MSKNNHFKNNYHVISYLDYYLSLNSPEYAVLINGDWGIGKTFLMKEYTIMYSQKVSNIDKAANIKWNKKFKEWIPFYKNNKKQNIKKIIHISLNGIGSREEVNEAITEEVYPIWKNKWIKSISKLGSENVKMIAKLKSVDLKSLDIKHFLNLRRSDIIYVFDDLERCSMPLEDILGYINTFVEYDHCNVLIIANEEEIRKKIKNNSVGKEKECIYDKIKEKIIGKTLTLVPETEIVMDSFFEDIQFSSKGLLKWKNFIASIYKKSTLNNLRILKQSICDFERIYNILEERHKKNDEFMEILIHIFFALSFEIKSGHFSCRDFEYWKHKEIQNLVGRPSTEDKEETPLSKYNGVHNMVYYGSFFSCETLSNILENGFVSKEDIRKEINKLSYFNGKEERSWRKICFWRDMRSEEVEKFYRIFEEEFEQRKFIDFGEILHVFGLKIFLADKGIISKEMKDIVWECMNYADDILKYAVDYNWHESIMLEGVFHGLSFYSHDSEEWKRVASYLNDKIKQKEHRQFIEKIRKNIFLNIKAFEACMKDALDSKYCEIPISDYTDIKPFCEFLLKGTTREGYMILRMLKQRYRGRRDIYDREKPTLVEIRDYLSKIQVNIIWEKLSIDDYLSLMNEEILTDK